MAPEATNLNNLGWQERSLPRGLSGSSHWALTTLLLKQLDDRAKGGPDSPNVITYNTAPGQELGLGLLWGFAASATPN